MKYTLAWRMNGKKLVFVLIVICSICYRQNLGAMDLILATVSGKTARINALIKAGANVNYQHKQDLAPLHIATIYGDKSSLAILLNCKNIKIDLKDKKGRTALHIAAMYGYTGICRMLLEHGADVNQHDNKRKTPLYWAQDYGSFIIEETPLERQNIQAAYHYFSVVRLLKTWKLTH